MEVSKQNPASTVGVKIALASDGAGAGGLEVEHGLSREFASSRTVAGGVRRRYALVIGCGVAVLVLAAAAIAAVVLSLRASSSTGVRVPEEFSVSFSAKGAGLGADDTTPYTGQLHKKSSADGSSWTLSGVVEYTSNGQKTVTTLVNNRAYYVTRDATSGAITSTGCLTEHDIPPMSELQAAFDSATPLSAQESVVDHLEGKCADTQKHVIAWAGQTYVFCAVQGDDGASYGFVGEEFSADLFDMREGDAAIKVQVPTDAAGAALQCPELSAGTSTSTASSRRLGVAGEVEAPWYLKSTQEARRLNSVNKCVFMHGLGHSSNAASTSTFNDYWGSVHNYAKCNSFVFIKRDTKNTAWDDPALLSHFCSEAGGPTISNTYIFSHSMGSLIVAGALQSGRCSLASSSKWFQIEGPLAGSRAADYASTTCAGSSVAKAVVDAAGFCGGASVQSLETSYSGSISFSSLVNVIANNVDGVMCGTSAWGISSWASAGMEAVRDLIKFSGSNDAVVRLSSCKTGVSNSFSNSFSSAFYTPAVNHFDGTCRNGNGWWGQDRKPCDWFKHMT